MGDTQKNIGSTHYSVIGLTGISGIMDNNGSDERIQKWIRIMNDFFEQEPSDEFPITDQDRASLAEFVASFMEGANDAESLYRSHYCAMVVNKIFNEFGYSGLCELMVTMDKRAGWISEILIESPDLDEILFKKYNTYDEGATEKARQTVAMQDLNGKIWRLRRKYTKLIVDEMMNNAIK